MRIYISDLKSGIKVSIIGLRLVLLNVKWGIYIEIRNQSNDEAEEIDNKISTWMAKMKIRIKIELR